MVVDTDTVWVELIVKNYIEWVVDNFELVNNLEPVLLAFVEPDIVVLTLLVVGLAAKWTLKGRNMPDL